MAHYLVTYNFINISIDSTTSEGKEAVLDELTRINDRPEIDAMFPQSAAECLARSSVNTNFTKYPATNEINVNRFDSSRRDAAVTDPL